MKMNQHATDEELDVLQAFSIFLRSVARLAVSSGVTYGQLSSSLKAAFVETATREFGSRHRNLNSSRASAITGISRREVARIRKDLRSGASPVAAEPPLLTRVAKMWRENSKYQDSEGRPARLPEKSEELSFESLVRDVGGNVPPGAIRAELLRHACIVSHEDGSLELVAMPYLSAELKSRLRFALLNSLRVHVDTVWQNMKTEKHSLLMRDGTVASNLLEREAARSFERYATEQLDDLEERLLAALNVLVKGADDANADGDENQASYVGVGFFQFESDPLP